MTELHDVLDRRKNELHFFLLAFQKKAFKGSPQYKASNIAGSREGEVYAAVYPQ